MTSGPGSKMLKPTEQPVVLTADCAITGSLIYQYGSLVPSLSLWCSYFCPHMLKLHHELFAAF